MNYEKGLSAMVFYACSAPGETLRKFVFGRGARQLRQAIADGACWIRFAEVPEPMTELDRLLKGFAKRFGSLPISNIDRVATGGIGRANEV
jgi:hypothetical protein